MVAPLWLIRLTDALSKVLGGPPGWREEWDAIPYELGGTVTGRIRKADYVKPTLRSMHPERIRTETQE